MAKRIATAVILAVAAALGLSSDLDLDRTALQGARVCPHDPEQLYIPAGTFLMGSTREERERAYELDKGVTRPYGWDESESWPEGSEEALYPGGDFSDGKQGGRTRARLRARQGSHAPLRLVRER